MDRRDFLAAIGLDRLFAAGLRGRPPVRRAAERTADDYRRDLERHRPDDRPRRRAGGAQHDAGRAGLRRAGGRRRPGRRLRGGGGGAQRGQGRAGAGPLAAGRQLVQRGQDARRRRQLPQGPARLARGRPDRRVPPRRRRQQPAALLGAVGPACSTTRSSASRTSPCCSTPTLYAAEVKDGRIESRDGPLRQDRAPLPHHRQALLRLHRRQPPGPGSRGRDARRPRGPRGVRRVAGRRRPPTSRRRAAASCSPRATSASRCRSRRRSGRARSPRSNCASAPISSWEYGYWWIEWGGELDTIRDNERIRFELLAIVMGVWDHIKNSGKHPDSANWAMDWVGMLPGKRESRRLVGDHMLTQYDLMGLNGDFDDAVGHRRLGPGRAPARPASTTPTSRRSCQIKLPEVYNIPLRSLYSKNVDEPDDGRPQHQRQPRRLHLDARDGHLRRRGPGGGHGRRPVRPAAGSCRGSCTRTRRSWRSSSRRCSATTRRSRA